MNKKTMMALGLMLLIAANVGAEQPKAAEYRQILQSGKYYVAYETDAVDKALAVAEGKRMDYTMGKAQSVGLIFVKIPIGEKSRKPTAFYQDGKYYQFDPTKKKVAHMAYTNQLNDPNVDPQKGWNTIQARLSLPEELAILAPNDPFNKFIDGFSRPFFVESGKKTVMNKKGKGETYTFDKYQANRYALNGAKLYNKYYYFLYDDKGDLKKVQTTIQAGKYPEEELQTIKVNQITSELPGNGVKMPAGTKVYALGTGDINDLTDKLPLVEDYSVKGEEESK